MVNNPLYPNNWGVGLKLYKHSFTFQPFFTCLRQERCRWTWFVEGNMEKTSCPNQRGRGLVCCSGSCCCCCCRCCGVSARLLRFDQPILVVLGITFLMWKAPVRSSEHRPERTSTCFIARLLGRFHVVFKSHLELIKREVFHDLLRMTCFTIYQWGGGANKHGCQNLRIIGPLLLMTRRVTTWRPSCGWEVSIFAI